MNESYILAPHPIIDPLALDLTPSNSGLAVASRSTKQVRSRFLIFVNRALATFMRSSGILTDNLDKSEIMYVMSCLVNSRYSTWPSSCLCYAS